MRARKVAWSDSPAGVAAYVAARVDAPRKPAWPRAEVRGRFGRMRYGRVVGRVDASGSSAGKDAEPIKGWIHAYPLDSQVARC